MEGKERISARSGLRFARQRKQPQLWLNGSKAEPGLVTEQSCLLASLLEVFICPPEVGTQAREAKRSPPRAFPSIISACQQFTVSYWSYLLLQTFFPENYLSTQIMTNPIEHLPWATLMSSKSVRSNLGVKWLYRHAEQQPELINF